jgi:DMSO/TMAO reductase YedYZ molybdopterin-dependent catalytic subunit
MTAAPHTARPHTAPAYYLGRPASWWIATAVGRRRAAGPCRAAAQAAQHAGAAVAGPGAAGRQAIGAGLLVHQADPLNAETPLAALAGQAIVPAGRFYIRNHFPIPAVDPRTWRLRVGGLAGRPLALSLADLQTMPHQTVVATLECAGNGRSALDPPVPGEQWGLGAAGTAAWTGVPLADVLALAAPDARAREVVFRGADRGLADGRDQPVHFERSLPLRYLGSARPLLAWAMNKQPLPTAHGFPLRLIVPGWYGVASVKWLTHITLTGQPFDGYFQADRYHIGGEPLTVQAVRSVITEPQHGQGLEPGDVVIRGLAWSGAAPIARVEVSIAPRPWEPATLTGPGHARGWQPWQLRARLERPGSVIIWARATDLAGRTQPVQPVWNPFGYAANAVHRIQVSVRR